MKSPRSTYRPGLRSSTSSRCLTPVPLDVFRDQLKHLLPQRQLRLTQVRDSLVVEGRPSDPVEVERIIDTIQAYLDSVNAQVGNGGRATTPKVINLIRLPPPQDPLEGLHGQLKDIFPDASLRLTRDRRQSRARAGPRRRTGRPYPGDDPGVGRRPTGAPGRPGRGWRRGPGGDDGAAVTDRPPGAETPGRRIRVRSAGSPRGSSETTGRIRESQIINLIRVPGSQQVLLKVRVAELNRTGHAADRRRHPRRQIPEFGAMRRDPDRRRRHRGLRPLTGRALDGDGQLDPGLTTATTVFGIFQDGELRDHAERPAAELAAEDPGRAEPRGPQRPPGQLPGRRRVPGAGAPGGRPAAPTPTITVQFKEFGVRLAFLPVRPRRRGHPADGRPRRSADRLRRSPRRWWPAARPVPGLNTRKAADHRRAAAGADPGHRRPAATDPGRDDDPHPRPGRPAGPRPVLQQHHERPDREGAGRAGDALPGRADGPGPGAPGPRATRSRSPTTWSSSSSTGSRAAPARTSGRRRPGTTRCTSSAT